MTDTSAVFRPPLDVGPVPRGSAADRPLGFGEASPSCSPGVYCASGDTQAGGYLDGANGVTSHAESVGKVLTDGKGCGHNAYMTNTERTQPVRLTRVASGEYICPPLNVKISRARVRAGGSRMTVWDVSRNEVTATFQTLDDVRAWLNGLVQA